MPWRNPAVRIKGARPYFAPRFAAEGVVRANGLLYCTDMAANYYAIRAIRQSKGIGLRTLEQQTGITRGFLSQIECGKRGASPRTLSRLAEAFGVPVEAITLPQPIGSPS